MIIMLIIVLLGGIFCLLFVLGSCRLAAKEDEFSSEVYNDVKDKEKL